MPLIKRKVFPVYLSRKPKEWKTTRESQDEAAEFQGEYDLNAVANVTLCSALRQLSSILLIAQEIHKSLQHDLDGMYERAANLSTRLAALEVRVVAHNPRTVCVPVSDLRTFSERKEHFVSKQQLQCSFFTCATRPPEVAELYQKAAAEPANVIREIHAQRKHGEGSSQHYVCQPVFVDSLKKEKERRLNLDIETRSFVALREWCSDDETLQSEVDLAPVSPSAPPCPPSTPHPAGQKLPLPEQRLIALSAKYPPKVVAIDVSGKGFRRMELFRQSLIQYEYGKAKRKRRRLRRRNTIADSREVRAAAVLADKSFPSTSSGQGRSTPCSGSSSCRGGALFYVDHSFDTTIDSSSTKTGEREGAPNLLLLGTHTNIPFPPRVSLCSSSRHLKQTCNSFREGNSRDEGTRSSSGNWSGSSSPRTSFESDNQNVNPPEHQKISLKIEDQPDSSSFIDITSQTPSFEQDSTFSESYQVRSSSPSIYLRSISGATDEFLSSSSYASDGTLTPTQDIQDIPFFDDDTSSAFSCDAEGYYTSFHIDSGLRSVSNEGSKLASDSDCDAFARGSTGTTNSSASLKTVIMRNPEKKTPPKPPQRVSSLERKENRESIITVIHVNGSTSSREDVAGAEISDRPVCQDRREAIPGKEAAGMKPIPAATQNASVPVRNISTTQGKTEGQETMTKPSERDSFKVKTAINASGIPSLCAITPPQSDDESVRSSTNVSDQAHKQQEVKQRSSSGQPAPPSRSKTMQQPSPGPGIRQPGDGEVAPIEHRSSPSFSTHSLGRQTGPSLKLMAKKRESDPNLQNKSFMPVESQTAAKSQPEQYSLGKSVMERRNEIQLKVLGKRKPSSDVLLQRQSSREMQLPKENSSSNDAEASFKEVPQTACATHSFSAIPAAIKQKIVITPTNSLERRKANSKSGAHVTLDSEGKVVYSSDSLPRKKPDSSTFEPGPYIKPPPIVSSSVTQTKTKLGYSSIQNMPLPPVPGEARTNSITTTPAVTPRMNPPTVATTGFIHPTLGPSMPTPIQPIKEQQQANMSMPPQPKLGTQTQIGAITQTLPGLSSHLQPRTVSQINSIRYSRVKDNKTPSLDSQQGSLDDSSEGVVKSQPHPPSDINELQNQAKFNQRLQQQIKEQLDSKTEPINSRQLMNTSLHNTSSSSLMESEEAKPYLMQPQMTQSLPRQKDMQLRQMQQHQNQAQLLHQIHQQTYQQQQIDQYKLQQQVLLHHRQQQQQLQQLQEQQQIKKIQISEQQMQKPNQKQALTEGQLAALSTDANVAAQKDTQFRSQEEALYQTRLDIHRQQLLQQSVGYQQAGYVQSQDLQMTKQQLIHHNQHQLFLQEQYMKQHRANESKSPGPTEVIAAAAAAAQGAPMSPHSQRVVATTDPYLHVQNHMPPSIAQQPNQTTSSSTSQPEQAHISRVHQNTTTHIGTTSRAPTPIQGLSSSSPHHLPSLHSSATLPHNLRSHAGISSSFSPISGNELDTSTDRVFLALAHARLATESFKSPKGSKRNLSECNTYIPVNSPNEQPDHLDVFNDSFCSNSSFVRNNSYKLATTPPVQGPSPPSYGFNSAKTVDAIFLDQLPVLNERPLYGPRLLPQSLPNKGTFGIDPKMATYPRRKLSTDPECAFTSKPSRHKFYGAKVVVDPNLLSTVRSQKNNGSQIVSNLNNTSNTQSLADKSVESCTTSPKPRVVAVKEKEKSPFLLRQTEIW